MEKQDGKYVMLGDCLLAPPQVALVIALPFALGISPPEGYHPRRAAGSRRRGVLFEDLNLQQTSEGNGARRRCAPMAMACRQCGECCDPILLRATKREIRADPSLDGDAFILRHWRRISQREAFRKRPILRKSHYPGRCYYLCDRFDPVSRRCTAHEERPPICRAFPSNLRIEGRPLRLRTYPNCGYNETVSAGASSQAVSQP